MDQEDLFSGLLSATDSSKLSSDDDRRPEPGPFDRYQIPVEIIARILEFCTHEKHNRKGPLPLLAVCSRWREISLKAPGLWTTLVCRVKRGTDTSKVQFAIDWLNRSGTLPLTVALELDPDDKELEALLIPLVDLVNQALARCVGLTLLNLSYLTLSRFTPIQGSPILNRLVFEPLDASILDLGLGAKPRELVISRARLGSLGIDWNDITELHTYRLQTNEVYRLLWLAPQMTKCYHASIQGPDILPSDILIHPRLESLEYTTVDESSSQSFGFFLRAANLPNLACCSVFLLKTQFPTEDFLDFVARSSCIIQELHINSAYVTSDELIEMVRFMPSIIHLTLFHDIDDDDDLHESVNFNKFYHELCLDSKYRNVLSDNENVLLPCLQSLTIYTGHPVPWRYLPGFYYRFRHDRSISTMPPGRPHLKSIDISCYGSERGLRHSLTSRNAYEDNTPDMKDVLRDPSKLIKTWDALFLLQALKRRVLLKLKVADAFNRLEWYDLFEVSQRYLEDHVGLPLDTIDGFIGR